MSFIPLETQSVPSWPGLNPQRFTGGRKHLTAKDTITKDFSGGPLTFLGRKHYEEKYDKPYIPKPTLRIFENHNKPSNKQILPNTKKHYSLSMVKNHPPKLRPELKHYPKETGLSEKEWYFKGIKVFDCNNKPSEGEWRVESIMQGKKRCNGFSLKRNGLPITALGDKCYKHPDYSSNFFKGGGLIPGSNFFVYKKKSHKKPIKGITIVHYKDDNMTWKEKLAKEQRLEDQETVECIEKWEEQILAEANPNWRDPEKVGPPDLFAEREKLAAAGGKKPEAGKKK